MREICASLVEEWDLTLVATSTGAPLRTLEDLGSAVTAAGGWVRRRGGVSERCADMDFECPRRSGIEVYSLLMAAGLELSSEGHEQLTGLCHCTGHVQAAEREAVVRVHLSIYGHEGSESFFGEAFGGIREAA